MNERGRDEGEGEGERARYLKAEGEPAFTVTRGELKQMVREAVASALDVRPVLVDKSTLAKCLQCSPAHIDNLRKVGLPTVRVGESPRFDVEAVLAWLRSRQPENDR